MSSHIFSHIFSKKNNHGKDLLFEIKKVLPLLYNTKTNNILSCIFFISFFIYGIIIFFTISIR